MKTTVVDEIMRYVWVTEVPEVVDGHVQIRHQLLHNPEKIREIVEDYGDNPQKYWPKREVTL